MAKQRGPLKIEGTLDEINFIKSIDGYVARMKGGVSASRIKSDPAFALTRQNNVEFTTACKGGKLIRENICNSCKKCRGW
jgi:hypothetical protein